MTTLETERLILRPFVDDDLSAFAAICADPEVMRYIGSGQPLSRAGAWRAIALFIGHWRLRGYGQWAVVEKESGELVGRAGLWNPEGWPGLEVGWLLARSRWRQGLGTEAARASLDYAFDVVRADHVISVIHAENVASIRLAEKIGERFERQATVDGIEVGIYGVSWRGRVSEQL